MTSPLRKKHPTILRNTTAASPPDSGRINVVVGDDEPRWMHDEGVPPSIAIRRSSFDSSTWLPAALLATLTLLAGALQAFGGETNQLQWRPAFASPSSQTAQPQISGKRAFVARKSNVATANTPVVQAHAKQSRHRQVTSPQQGDRRFAVVQAAYDDQNWNTSAGGANGKARLQSVVVHPRDPQFVGTGPTYRTAQDPFENDSLDEELAREINQPFGENQVPEALPELDAGELPVPEEPILPEPVENTIPEIDFSDTAPEEFDDPMPEPMPEPMTDDELFSDMPDDETTMQPGASDTDEAGRYEPVPRDERRSSNNAAPTTKAAAKFEEERRKAAENCQQAIAEARLDRISSIDLGIRVTGKEGLDYPFECSIDDGTIYADRAWPEVTYMWKAAANCHKPLYFEQQHLERYGHSWGPCLQPLVSGAHFFTRLPVLPYCMGLTPPNECIYPLGHYRPGNCAPYMVDPIPFSWRAALFEAGAVVGTAAVLP